MIISRNNKPKFKLQTAYDTLTSRLRGLGYDVDGNIELDTSGYGHGWIKVLRNGRKNNFIYMCSHSDNVDPLCCEPVYRYIKVYNYCDDPKDSNLLGEIPMVVDNINSLPNMTEVYKDDEYKVYKNTASDIVWGFMNLDEGHVAQAPWTPYPTTIKSLSGEDLVYGVPTYDIIDNKAIKLEDGTTSAFDDLFEDEDTLYLGQSKEVSQLYTWNSYISGAVYSETLNTSIDKTICPYCFGSGEINYTPTGPATPCTHCKTDDDINVSELEYKGTDYERFREIPLVQSSYDELIYNYEHSESGAPFLLNGSILSVETTVHAGGPSTKRLDQSITAEKIKDNDYKITYCLHKLGETKQQATTLGGQTFVYRDNRIIKREFIATLSETEYTTVQDTFTYKNLSNITVEINLPPTKDLVEATYVSGWQTGHSSYLDAPNTITRSYLHAYMKGHKDLNGEYENIMVHVNNGNSKPAEILNYMLHSKTKTFEYSPKYTWNYDEIMNFILYKDENLPVMPSRNGIYHLKTNYYNELNNLSDIGNMENVLDGNTCMHVGYLGDNQMHSAYNVILDDDKDNDISYLQAYNYVKDPYKSRYNYFPSEETQNMLYWNTPKNGFFEGVFQFHNDIIDAVPNKYVWLTLNESAYDVQHNATRNGDPIQYEPFYLYEGNIDTAEIRKPTTDKEWQWRNNFHNFMTNREVKAIYYKESFSAHDTLSAGSALTFTTPLSYRDSDNFKLTQAPFIDKDYFNKGTDMKVHNNICWNGLSAYRHVCRTCSGVGLINPYKNRVNNWANDPVCDASPFYELQSNDLLCPTCGRTGINIRYLYYKHKYVKPLSMYGLQLNDVADPRISNKNQLLLPTNLMDEDIKKDLILYTTSAEPIGYSACTVYGSKLTYKKAYLGYGQMWNYVDVPRDVNNNFQFITDFHQIYPKWDRLTGTEQNKIRKQYQNQLYRGIELPDNFVQYYAFRGQDKNVTGGPKDAWSRIFFDPKWIEKQYFENNTLENPCQYNLKEEIINRGEHNHNHVSQEKYTLNMNNRYYPYYGEIDHHDRTLELDYRKTGVKLQHTCKMCNGEGEIDVYKVNSNGEVIYDIMNNPTIVKDVCPVCNGNGYLEDTHREDYNIAQCDHCHDTGHVVCPTCLGLGTTYKAKHGYTYEESTSLPQSSIDDRKNHVVGYIQTNSNNEKTVLFFTFALSGMPKGGYVWIPIQHGDPIVYSEEPPDDLTEMVELKPCPNCSRYIDTLEVGQIPCPECGGTFKYKNSIYGDTEEKHYRIAPGNEDNKKLYKYISINAVSIDNISIEMDNG